MPTSNVERRLSSRVRNPDTRYGFLHFDGAMKCDFAGLIDRSILRGMTVEKKHDHTVAEEREIREAALDDTIEDSFPASDPPSTNPNPDDHDAVRREPRRARGTIQ